MNIGRNVDQYAVVWRRLRVAIRVQWASFAVVAAFILLGSVFPSMPLALAVLLCFLAVVAFVAGFWACWRTWFTACPRCGEPFLRRKSLIEGFESPFQNKCVHCGLPMGAVADGPPRHPLPYRSATAARDEQRKEEEES
jgi:hypothetical protein